MNDTEGALVGGRYRLDQPIGRGRAGIVWLAFDTMLHRTVAAKRLCLDHAGAHPRPAGPAPDRESAARALLVQAENARRVSDPGAVRVHDALRDGGDVWVVMEYVPSRTMADFLREHGTLTPDQAAYLGVALSSALVTAHDAGVPHGRVEPGTVLLADDGGVKLTDIGIHDAEPDHAYRAPELARHGTATPAADAYSLGATLFTAVEGAAPYGPDGTGEPVVPTHSGPLTAALLKLLRADPDLRPTLHDTVAALQAIDAGRAEGFVPPTAPAMPTVPLLPRPPRAAIPDVGRAAKGTSLPVPRPASSLTVWLAWCLLALVVAATVAVAVSVL